MKPLSLAVALAFLVTMTSCGPKVERAAPPNATAAPPAPLWNVSSSKDTMTDEISHIAQRAFNDQNATINFSCHGKLWEFFILDKAVFGDGFEDTKFRFNDNQPIDVKLLFSKGLFGGILNSKSQLIDADHALSDMTAHTVMAYIQNPTSKRMRVRISPPSGTKDYDFALDGASDAMAELLKFCSQP
jgi:hypothetical protein